MLLLLLQGRMNAIHDLVEERNIYLRQHNQMNDSVEVWEQLLICQRRQDCVAIFVILHMLCERVGLGRIGVSQFWN